MYIGLNLTHQNDYDSDEKFANCFFNSRSPQIGYGPTLPTPDADGWPTSDFRQVIYGYNPNLKVKAAGVYAIKFTGQATLGSYGGSISNVVYNAGTNTTTAKLTVATGWLFDVYIDFDNTQRTAGSTTNTGITNIFVMRPIAEGSSTPHDYDEFLSRNFTKYINEGAYQGLRMMDIAGTNSYPWPGVSTLTWGQRTPGYMPNQSGSYSGTWGTSIEVCVAICNATNKDMFYCVPDCADDDYLLKLMQTIRYGSDGRNPYTSPQANPVFAPLKSNLKVYLEWGNEVWNQIFTQNPRNYTLAGQLVASQDSPVTYDGTTDQTLVFHRLWGEKTVQISKVARQVFGDAAMMSRVRPVIFGQDDSGDNNGILRNALDYINNYYNNPAKVADPHPVTYYVWGGGCGGYRGFNATDTSGTTTADAIIASGVAADRPLVNTLARPAVMASYGLHSVIYEGALVHGTDANVTTFAVDFNQDSRLRPLVKAYYEELENAGYDALFIFASSNGIYAQSYSTEPAHVAAGPRYLAAQDFAGTQPVDPVDPVDPEIPGDGVTPLDPITWTNIDNLASTTLAVAHAAGSPSLVLRDASKFNPTSSDPRIVTVIKSDGSTSCHFKATAKVGNVLTVSVTDGYTDPGFRVGDKVIQAFNAERLKEVRDGIDALVEAHNDLAKVAETGSYADLSNKPTIPTLPTLATVATTGSYTDLTNKPALATVATSGSYTDLANKPALGTLASQNGTFSGTHSGSSSGTNTGDQTITLTGDVTGSGTGTFTTTLATSGVTAGSYTLATFTVDTKGRITSASSGTPVAPGGSSGQVQYRGGDGSFTGTSGITTDGQKIDVGTTTLAAGSLVTGGGVLRQGQTGAQYGPIYLDLKNEQGANGAIFTSTGGTTLIDFGFNTVNNFQSNIRYECRSNYFLGGGNNGGEFQFILGANYGAAASMAVGGSTILLAATSASKVGVRVASPQAALHTSCEAAEVGRIVQAAAGQSADLDQYRDSTGAVLSGVDAKGCVRTAITSGQPTTTPAIGSMMTDPAANKLWIYCSAGWKSATLS